MDVPLFQHCSLKTMSLLYCFAIARLPKTSWLFMWIYFWNLCSAPLIHLYFLRTVSCLNYCGFIVSLNIVGTLPLFINSPDCRGFDWDCLESIDQVGKLSFLSFPPTLSQNKFVRRTMYQRPYVFLSHGTVTKLFVSAIMKFIWPGKQCLLVTYLGSTSFPYQVKFESLK